MDPTALETAKAEYGAGRAYTDYRALLDDPESEVVSLCVPQFLHRSMGSDMEGMIGWVDAFSGKWRWRKRAAAEGRYTCIDTVMPENRHG